MGELRLVVGGFASRGLAGLSNVELQFEFWGQEGPPVSVDVPLLDLSRIPSALNTVAAELSHASSAGDLSLAGDGLACDVAFPLYTDEHNFAAYLRDMVGRCDHAGV